MKKIVVAIAVSVLFIISCQKVQAHEPKVVDKPKPQLCGSDMVNCF